MRRNEREGDLKNVRDENEEQIEGGNGRNMEEYPYEGNDQWRQRR